MLQKKLYERVCDRALTELFVVPRLRDFRTKGTTALKQKNASELQLCSCAASCGSVYFAPLSRPSKWLSPYPPQGLAIGFGCSKSCSSQVLCGLLCLDVPVGVSIRRSAYS